MKKVLCTGGAGFFGHHFVEHILKETDWDIVVWDKLTYASNGHDRLKDIEAFDDKRVTILGVDFTIPISDGVKKETGTPDYIAHIGAETHVDNSIEDPKLFLHANVTGTVEMLEYAREVKPEKFIYFSTDEVFGPGFLKGKPHDFVEGEPHNPGNPYAAAKAAAEDFCVAYANTYGVPVIITNTMNLFGERQHPEKFIPLVINKTLKGETVTIHSNKEKTHSGTRYYIHCRNAAQAIHKLLVEDTPTLSIHDREQGRYNIVGEKEVSNLELAELIAEFVKKPLKYEMVDFHSSRPGHDLRYGLNGKKMYEMGWSPPMKFEESLKKTVEWMLDRKEWL